MTDGTDEEWYVEDELPLQPARRRTPLVLALVSSVVVAGAALAYAWFHADSIFASSRVATDNAEMTAGDKAMLTDLLAGQQKTSADLEVLTESVTDQQAQIKAISEQVSALASRVDALQSATRAQAPSATAQPEAPAQVAPKQAKKRAQGPKPAGLISVGGAPLNPAAASR
jgi:hypothetical protein